MIEEEKDVQTNASPIAADAALINRNTDITKLRMFLGALVNAYSRPVIDARISEKAISMYLRTITTTININININTKRCQNNSRAALDPYIKGRDERVLVRVHASCGVVPTRVRLVDIVL
jgi:hypothetical protein